MRSFVLFTSAFALTLAEVICLNTDTVTSKKQAVILNNFAHHKNDPVLITTGSLVQRKANEILSSEPNTRIPLSSYELELKPLKSGLSAAAVETFAAICARELSNELKPSFPFVTVAFEAPIISQSIAEEPPLYGGRQLRYVLTPGNLKIQLKITALVSVEQTDRIANIPDSNVIKSLVFSYFNDEIYTEKLTRDLLQATNMKEFQSLDAIIFSRTLENSDIGKYQNLTLEPNPAIGTQNSIFVIAILSASTILVVIMFSTLLYVKFSNKNKNNRRKARSKTSSQLKSGLPRGPEGMEIHTNNDMEGADLFHTVLSSPTKSLSLSPNKIGNIPNERNVVEKKIKKHTFDYVQDKFRDQKDVMTHISTREQNTVSTLGMESLVFQDLIQLLKEQGIDVVKNKKIKQMQTLQEEPEKIEAPPPQKSVYIPQLDPEETEDFNFDDMSSITSITGLTDLFKQHIDAQKSKTVRTKSKANVVPESSYTIDANFLLSVANQWYEQFSAGQQVTENDPELKLSLKDMVPFETQFPLSPTDEKGHLSVSQFKKQAPSKLMSPQNNYDSRSDPNAGKHQQKHLGKKEQSLSDHFISESTSKAKVAPCNSVSPLSVASGSYKDIEPPSPRSADTTRIENYSRVSRGGSAFSKESKYRVSRSNYYSSRA